MGVTKVRWALYMALIMAFLGGLFSNLLVSSGRGLPILSWGTVISLLVINLFLSIAIWKMFHTYRVLSKVLSDPLLPFRIVVLAKSAIFCGSILLGWHIGVMFYLFFAGNLMQIFSRLVMLLSLVAVTSLFIALGFVLEYFCRLPKKDLSEE